MTAAPEAIGVRDGRLWVDAVPAGALARRFGTPLNVVSEAQLRANARTWAAAVAGAWPGGRTGVLPSLKANTSLALRRILNQEGMGCDVFGRHELELALRAGVPPDAISLNGATKDDGVLALAIERGVHITLDSLDEVRRTEALAAAAGTIAVVRLRLRPWLAASAAVSDFVAEPLPAHLAVHDYRAGMPLEEARAGAALAHASPHLDLAGVAAHVSRQTTDLSFWTALGVALSALVGELCEHAPGWLPREIDVGGGFAVPRDPTGRALPARRAAPRAPRPEAYMAAITGPLIEGLRVQSLDPSSMTLQIEPGRALYGDAGIHLTTVRHVKRQAEPVARTWIETDTSEAFLADTVIEHNAWVVVPVDDPARAVGPEAAITGVSCGWDVLGEHEPRPAVRPGEVLAFLDTGAYQDATASNFNAMGRPATVLVCGQDAEVVKTAETLDDLLLRERIPERLRTSVEGDGDGPAVLGLDHVGLSCADLDRAVAFFCGLLELPIRDQGELDGVAGTVTGHPELRGRFVDVDLGAGRTLELFDIREPHGSPVVPGALRPGGGHLALRVSGIDALVQRLAAAGYRARSPAAVELEEAGFWHGARVVYVDGPDGVVVELLQRESEG